MTEIEQRQRVVEEARSWLCTPYHHQGRVKGAGVDCLMLLCEVYHAAGMVPYIDPRPYPHDWHLHRSDERYLKGLLQYARPVERPNAGDVAIFRFGRCYSHGAIMIGETALIHSYLGLGVELGDLNESPLAGRPSKFFSLWA